MSDYPTTSNDTSPLFDLGTLASETRADAFAKAESKRGKRVDEGERILLEAGPTGCIRHELAAEFKPEIPLASVCGIALKLLDAGIAFERGKRLSPYGSPAAVLVHRDHLHGGGQQ